MNQNIQLLVQWPEQGSAELDDTSWMEGADALVIDPSQCNPEQFECTGVERAIIRNGDPQQHSCWLEYPTWWVLEDELEQIARRRDAYPDLTWIPCLSVARAQVTYRFSGTAAGEGFSFYMPDTAAIKGWRINGAEYSLHEAVTRATELGLSALWLHSPEAEARGKGLELDMLDKVRGGPLEVWLSGGASELKHLRSLSKTDGAAAVVVRAGLVRGSSISALREAMLPDDPVTQAIPIKVERQSTQAG